MKAVINFYFLSWLKFTYELGVFCRNVKNIQKMNERMLEMGVEDSQAWHKQYKDSAYVFIGKTVQQALGKTRSSGDSWGFEQPILKIWDIVRQMPETPFPRTSLLKCSGKGCPRQ